MSDSIRTKEEMFNSLIKIIKSKTFKRKLAKLNDNFFNLKQEIHIRNLLVELFNKKLKKEGERAIAEYRELQSETDKNIRIDLALSNREEVALIELKYHFANDPQIKKESLKNYFLERKECDYFISIICNGDKNIRKAYENFWNIETIFAGRYSDNFEWENILKEQFQAVDNNYETIKINVYTPFETTYHFFILKRK